MNWLHIIFLRIYDYSDRMAVHVNDLVDSASTPKVWVLISLVQWFIATYIFSEWGFAIGFFIVFIMDTMSGVYIAFRQKRYSGRVFRSKLADKSVAYFTIILAYSAGTKIALSEVDTNVIKYMDLPFYSIFTTAEIFSIIKKWYEFKRWPALARLMSHFTGFNDENGTPNEHADTSQREED